MQCLGRIFFVSWVGVFIGIIGLVASTTGWSCPSHKPAGETQTSEQDWELFKRRRSEELTEQRDSTLALNSDVSSVTKPRVQSENGLVFDEHGLLFQ